jgi:hypothetical protein
MSCNEYKNEILLYVYNELPDNLSLKDESAPGEKVNLEKHTLSCSKCSMELQNMKYFRNIYHEIEPEQPDFNIVSNVLYLSKKKMEVKKEHRLLDIIYIFRTIFRKPVVAYGFAVIILLIVGISIYSKVNYSNYAEVYEWNDNYEERVNYIDEDINFIKSGFNQSINYVQLNLEDETNSINQSIQELSEDINKF